MKSSYFFLVMTAAVSLSVNMVFIRRARMEYPADLYGLLQMSITCLGLLAFALARRGKAAFRGIREDLPVAALIGLIACGITWFILSGLGKSTATAGAVLQRTDILFTMAIGWVVVRDRFKPSDFLFLIVLVAGALEVMEFKVGRFELGNPYNLYFIGSAVGISINAFLIKYRIKRIEWDVLACVNTLIQSTFYLFIVFVLGGGAHWDALKSHTSTMWWVVSASVWLIIYFLTYYESLERLPVWFVRTFLLTMPVFTIIMEYFLFGTKLELRQLFGIALVTAGVLGLTLSRKNQSPALPEIPQ